MKEELNTLLLKTSLHTSVGISAHFPGNGGEPLCKYRQALISGRYSQRSGIFWIWLILGNSTLQTFTSYSCSVYNLCSLSAGTSKNVKPSNIFISLYCTVFSVPWLSKCFCNQWLQQSSCHGYSQWPVSQFQSQETKFLNKTWWMPEM